MGPPQPLTQLGAAVDVLCPVVPGTPHPLGHLLVALGARASSWPRQVATQLPCDQQLTPDQATGWDTPSPGREVALAQPQWPLAVTVTPNPPGGVQRPVPKSSPSPA